ncbi:MAG TPA: hypothetical protein PLH94_10390 [Fimbriimonadaceae bacterium]|nr:hypothetical protein [Fimbriimonadaceae bacterium]
MLASLALSLLQPKIVERPPVVLAVLRDGKRIGQTRIVQRLLRDGSKTVTVDMTLEQGTGKVRVRQESAYDGDGMPLRKLQETLDTNGKRLVALVATFDERGASLTKTGSGAPETQLIELVSGAPRAATNEFWFLRDQPKKGAKATYYSFAPSEGRWRLVEFRYDGLEFVNLIGRRREVHVVKTPEGNAYFDLSGDAVVVELNGLKLVRIED